MREVERVAGAGVVDVVALLVGQQPVVRAVVDAAEGKRRAALAALGGVVVDHVDDHFQPGVVEARHHLLELLQAPGRVGGVARVGREEADRVVAPVVVELLLEQEAVVDEGVHRQQLDARDAERLDVGDDLLVRQAAEGAALALRHFRVKPGVAAHVRLVDDGAVPRHVVPGLLALPVEARIHHHALRHEGRAVSLVEREVGVPVAQHVAEHRRVPAQAADVRARVRVEQQLVGIEAMALFGRVGPVHAVAVHGAGADLGHVAVPGLVAVFRQLDAFFFFESMVKETDLDLGRAGGEQREIDALAVPGRAARIRQALFHGHCKSCPQFTARRPGPPGPSGLAGRSQAARTRQHG